MKGAGGGSEGDRGRGGVRGRGAQEEGRQEVGEARVGVKKGGGG